MKDAFDHDAHSLPPKTKKIRLFLQYAEQELQDVEEYKWPSLRRELFDLIDRYRAPAPFPVGSASSFPPQQSLYHELHPPSAPSASTSQVPSSQVHMYGSDVQYTEPSATVAINTGDQGTGLQTAADSMSTSDVYRDSNVALNFQPASVGSVFRNMGVDPDTSDDIGTCDTPTGPVRS